MKVVKLSHPNYEYDVHSLVKAFYAEDQVTVITPETKPEKLAELEPQVSLEIELAETGAKIRVGEEDFLWDAETENLADGYKNGLKRFLYRTLSKVTGQKLPWGNLTGIRPTKIAYGMLDEGRSDAEILDFMEQSHYVSEEKALLGIDIAKRERDLLKEIHYEGGYSLYIGIPFCPTTCLYCSFTSYPIAAFRRQVDAYVDAVIKEMDYVAENFQDKVLDTVYIGGGTPTTLEPEQLDRLITALKSKFDFSTVKEFTVEAGRADSITREKLEVLYRHRVSRISVNPQTMKQETLDIIGRKASVEQVLTAYKLAREVGFDNINMDLILGLPGELEADVQRTIDKDRGAGPGQPDRSFPGHQTCIPSEPVDPGERRLHAPQHRRDHEDRGSRSGKAGNEAVLSLPTEEHVRQLREHRLRPSRQIRPVQHPHHGGETDHCGIWAPVASPRESSPTDGSNDAIMSRM